MPTAELKRISDGRALQVFSSGAMNATRLSVSGRFGAFKPLLRVALWIVTLL